MTLARTLAALHSTSNVAASAYVGRQFSHQTPLLYAIIEAERCRRPIPTHAYKIATVHINYL